MPQVIFTSGLSKKNYGNPHRLLLTSATITDRNREDLQKELGLGNRRLF